VAKPPGDQPRKPVYFTIVSEGFPSVVGLRGDTFPCKSAASTPRIMLNRLSRLVVDRSPREAAVAIGAAWLAFLSALPFAESDGVDLAYMLIGGAIGAGIIVTGFAAASRVRPLRQKHGAESFRRGAMAIALGAASGVVNLGINLALAAHPAIGPLLRERFVTLSPWQTSFAAPVLEEIAYRLFFLSVLAWIVGRFVRNPRTAFWVAMGLTAVFFGAMHLFRPMPEQGSAALLYSVAIVVKTGGMSLLFAWLFWRRGLPHAMLAHSAANAAHELLDPLLFG
jgi:hypothetical protein